MAAVHLTLDDLLPFAPGIDPGKAMVMIEDAIATAALIAPCIVEDSFSNDAAAKAILRAAILRWNDAGSGAVTQVSAGSFQQTIDNRSPRKSMFWPSEVTDLQKLCGISRSGKAYTVDTTPPVLSQHPLFGALVNGPDGWAPEET